jgi:hypothetical protein
MELHAAEALKSQRDQAVRAALKANVPWTEVVEVFGIGLEEILKISEQQGGPRRDDLTDARDEPKRR